MILPDPRAQKTRIAVHRIVDRDQSGGGGGCGEPRSRNVEERPEDDDAVAVDHPAHRGEPEDARAALETHQKGLGLIVAVMGEEQMRRPASRAAPSSNRYRASRASASMSLRAAGPDAVSRRAGMPRLSAVATTSAASAGRARSAAHDRRSGRPIAGRPAGAATGRPHREAPANRRRRRRRAQSFRHRRPARKAPRPRRRSAVRWLQQFATACSAATL